MKILIFVFACLVNVQLVSAQLKKTPLCPPLVADLLEGNVNDMFPKSTMGEVIKTLPCFTDMAEKDSATNCIGVFFKDKDIYFYTERDYIEIRENFQGKIIPPLMGALRSSLFNMLGHPQIKDVSWDAFQTKYGILVVYYNKAGKINKLQMSSKNSETLKLCE